jgi:Catalytic LigB subunit of aromatic ring-opening dioxygenase
MADIVIGIASSHTPQLSSGVEMWHDHAERDRRNPKLLGKDARYHTYDELLASADPGIAHELDRAVWDAKYQRCQEAIATLTERLGKAQPDVAIVIGDDQRELFRDDGIPAFACFAGDELVDMPPSGEALERMPAGIRAASWAAHSDHAERHPVSAELGQHVAECLAGADFDITVLTQQPPGRSLGHAFTFPRYRLGLPATTPIVPIFINTYYPPNVPSARRCYSLGQVICDCVRDWDPAARVAVIASGGLSHFVVDEDLDRRVLTGISQHDSGALGSLSREQLRSGTSEILNWITAAGALENLPATVIDYVPGYRTPAGTGAGMAFVQWD